CRGGFGRGCRAWARAKGDQGAAACGAAQRAWLRVAALFERADGLAACRVCGAADRLQLSWAVCGGWGGGRGGGGGGGWPRAPEAVGLGGGGDAGMAWAHCIEVNALTLEEAPGAQLVAHWSWAPALVTEQEVRDLAQGWFAALEALVRDAQRPGTGGRSPSDLPLVSLSQGEIERLERQYAQIEDV